MTEQQPSYEELVAEVRRLRADAAAELLPDWEAVYEPGNVSNYLIGYANDEAAAKGAAEAWLRSQAEVTGRLEWQPWGTATDMPDGYDAWFELAERHDDGIDTGPGIVVRRRTCCPGCGSLGSPADLDKSVTITITAHELRILTIWAANWENQIRRTGQAVEERSAVAGICTGLAQYTDAPLSISQEIADLRATFGVSNVTVTDEDPA